MATLLPYKPEFLSNSKEKQEKIVEANTKKKKKKKKKIFLQNLSPMFHMVSEEMIFKDILPFFFAFWLPL